ncbi:MAG: O-antigen ligase family protein [Methylohalobius sp.]
MQLRSSIAAGRWQAVLLVYALALSACFKILLPEVKITWLFYANLILLYFWPYLTRLWQTNLVQAPIPKLNIDGCLALLLAYAVFLGACLLVVVHGKKLWTLYTSLIIPWSWRYLPEFWKLAKASRLYQLILVYLGFLLASMFWSPQIEAKAVLSTLASGITIAHFVLLTAGLRGCHQEAFDRQLSWLCFLAAASASLVIAAWYSRHPFPQSRMEGFGYLDNPIQGAAVFGVFALIAWHRIMVCSHLINRLSYGLAFAAILAYACVSWTRSVLMAMGVSLILLIALQPNRKLLIPLGVLGSGGLVLAALTPELAATLTRPEPYRPYIWMEALTQAIRHPWLGQGYFANPGGITKLADGSLYHYAHSHSFFIENLRVGGVAGLGLAAWLLGCSLYRAFKGGAAAGNFLSLALLVYGFVCIAPNGWELLPGVRIKEVFMMFWLPLGLAVAEELRLSSAPGEQPTSPRSCAASDSGPVAKKR